MTLAALATLLGALNQELILTFTREVIEENRPLLEDMNTFQLRRGIRADGSDITPFYTPFTVQIKQEKGQQSDRVTLRDTGDFWESITAKAFGNTLEFTATDPKTEELQEKYGENIIGLTAENKSYFVQEYLKSELLFKLRRYLGL